MFVKLRNEIIEANEKLDGAKEESIKRRMSLLAQIEQEEKVIQLADDEMVANTALLNKIQDFIPSGGIK